MADNNGFSFFGYEFKKKEPKKQDKAVSFVEPTSDDSSGYVAAGGHYGQYVDIDGSSAKTESDLIVKYRQASEQPEVDSAIDDIVNEAIISDEDSAPVDIILDDLQVSDKIKKQIREEFDTIVSLLNFNNSAHDIFRRWYIDGRLPYHVMIDEKNPKNGILELRYIDPKNLRKVKELVKDKDEATGQNMIKDVKEYFIYQDTTHAKSNTGLKITKDAIVYVTSGLTDSSRKKTLSYIHKALKPINQLRMLEDALVIYRLSRAPERRIFYIDVGNLPKGKSEEYLRSIMNQYRNKLVYDASTGEIKDDKKHMSMLEDFWLPRREGGRGTEITTLPGGQNLGDIEDILYFRRKVYRSLNVPFARLEQEQTFTLGRANEVTRDEVKFAKFVNRLRKRFSSLFFELLKRQCILKGICTEEDWKIIREDIAIDFLKDNYYAELKETEILRERMQMLAEIESYAGVYFSKEWIRKNVLRQSDDDIKEMDKQIKAEEAAGEFDDEEDEPQQQQQQQPAQTFKLVPDTQSSAEEKPKVDTNESVEVYEEMDDDDAYILKMIQESRKD